MTAGNTLSDTNSVSIAEAVGLELSGLPCLS